MNAANLIPRFRLEIRESDAPDVPWQWYDFAHTEQQAEMKIRNFQAANKGFEIQRVPNTAAVSAPDSHRSHPEFIELSNLRDNVGAIFGTVDTADLKNAFCALNEAGGIISDLRKENDGLRAEIAATKTQPPAPPPHPFEEGDELQDTESDNVVTVCDVTARGFFYELPSGEKGYVPNESAHYFKPTAVNAETGGAGSKRHKHKKGKHS